MSTLTGHSASSSTTPRSSPSHGHATIDGTVACVEGFITAGKSYYYAYEQVMLELTIGEVHGTLQRDKGTVTFLGIKELETKRTFLDSVEGRVLWEKPHTWCEATASQVYLGTCLLYTSPSPRDKRQSRMPSSA